MGSIHLCVTLCFDMDPLYVVPSDIDCGDSLPIISHGNFGSVRNTIYLSSVNVVCNTGYKYSSNTTTVTCQADGNWSTPTGTCQGKLVHVDTCFT